MTAPDELRFYRFVDPQPAPPHLEGALLFACGKPVGLISAPDPITGEYSLIRDPEGEK